MKNQEFYMPAEWHTHERTIIEWPIKASLCHPENHIEVLESYAAVVKAIAAFEPVTLVVTKETKEEAIVYTENTATYVTIPHNDAWARDNGPTFVINETEIKGISWEFNAWGEKYSPYDLDNAMADDLLQQLEIDTHKVPMILEGGSIHVDGEGTLLSTKECLLNKNRNPHKTQSEIEAVLKATLGVCSFIWLEKGLFGDETDGHIDNIACFAKPGVVLLQTCYDQKDPNYAITMANIKTLMEAKDAKGRHLEIIEMPSPPPAYYKGERLTLSYLNFYFVNGGLVLPVFGGKAKETDQIAAEILKGIYPDRTIISVPSMGLIKEGGNIHCITQQMPVAERGNV